MLLIIAFTMSLMMTQCKSQPKEAPKKEAAAETKSEAKAEHKHETAKAEKGDMKPSFTKFPIAKDGKAFVCNCGDQCDCNSISNKAGKCGCGKELIEATAIKVEGDSATFQIGERTQTFKTTAKFACNCGESCDCKYMSNTGGKCICGKDLVAITN